MLSQFGSMQVTNSNILLLITLLTPFIATINFNFSGNFVLTLNAAFLSNTDFYKADFISPFNILPLTELQKATEKVIRLKQQEVFSEAKKQGFDAVIAAESYLQNSNSAEFKY